MSEINNPQVTNITETGCTVTWTSDDEVLSRVDYGPDVRYGSSHPISREKGDPIPKTTHSHVITGLLPGHSYYFRPVIFIRVWYLDYWRDGGFNFGSPMLATMNFDPGPHNDPGNAKFASVVSIAFDSPTGTKVYSFDDLRIKATSLP
jgi:hypothetical protein